MTDEQSDDLTQRIFLQGALLTQRIPDSDPASPEIVASIKTACAILVSALSTSDSPLFPSSGTASITSQGLSEAVVAGAWALQLRILQASDPTVAADPAGKGLHSATHTQEHFIACFNLDAETNSELTQITNGWELQLEDELLGAPGDDIESIAFHLNGSLYWYLGQCLSPEFGRIYEPDEIDPTLWPPEDPAEQAQLREGARLLTELTLAYTDPLFEALRNPN